MNDWKEGLKRALIDTIVKSGGLVRKDPSIYSWRDYDGTTREKQAREAIATVGIDYARTGMPDISGWAEFVGTFADPPTEARRGVDAVVVLNDGTEYTYRIETDLGRLIQKVVTA